MLKRTLLLMSLAATVVLSACNNDDDPVKDTVIDFSNLTLEEEETYYLDSEMTGEKGDDGWGGDAYFSEINSGILSFTHQYNAGWGGFAGYTYSNVSDATYNKEETDADKFLSYQSAAASNYDKNYLIAYPNKTHNLKFNTVTAIKTITINNNGTAYLSMKNGDAFAKKFGGEDGNDPDFFKVIFTGLDVDGKETGSVEFFLADYRFEDNSQDYILEDWTTVDLTGLGEVKEIAINFDSTDPGYGGGIQTPSYLAIGQLTY
ncbi:DUF4465 domain-containing protein [Persicobacter sp. CCB-QB2]|uniref:DUF4465 domain-containing protein n=1 Tax=Persicobacter sp. CCB-QB2 TaxID=1561025 RepID=UPI00155DB581|nr:DUF4465 domain-containing protein [Persicobacter sp. CCB-QB2]